jgi:hypothetical protein
MKRPRDRVPTCLDRSQICGTVVQENDGNGRIRDGQNLLWHVTDVPSFSLLNNTSTSCSFNNQCPDKGGRSPSIARYVPVLGENFAQHTSLAQHHCSPDQDLSKIISSRCQQLFRQSRVVLRFALNSSPSQILSLKHPCTFNYTRRSVAFRVCGFCTVQ